MNSQRIEAFSFVASRENHAKFILQASGRVLNLVTLAFAESGNLQISVDKAYKSLVEDIALFEEHAGSFLPHYGQSVVENEAKILVQGFRHVMAGCIKWQ